MRSIVMVVLAVLFGSASSGHAGSPPFAGPIKECHPCRFTPGKDARPFDLTFAFSGSGSDRTLATLDVAPSGGGKGQRLDTGGVDVSDFPEGFSLELTDLNRDGYADLGLVTATAADNGTEKYWLYEPARHGFVALDRGGDPGGDCPLQWDAEAAALTCHVKDSAATYTDYWYRIVGDRIVAIRKVDQLVKGNLVIHETSDLTVTPPRIVATATIGFIGASPERTAFVKRLHVAAVRANALYRHGDHGAALATMAKAFGDISPDALGDDQPDKVLAGDIDDYGFFLEEAGHPNEAIDPLQEALTLDPDRTVAYLNLGDALFAIGNKDGAHANYAEYRKRMAAAGKSGNIPPRVSERLR